MTKGKGRCKGGPPAQAPVMPRPRESSPVDEETLFWMTGGSGNNATSSAVETRVNAGRCDVQAIIQPAAESSDLYDITENVEVSDGSSVSSVTLLEKVDEQQELPTTDNSPTRDTERVILYDIIDGCTKCKQPCSLTRDESVIICGKCMNRIHAHCFLQIPDSCCPMCNAKIFAEGVITPAEFKESTKEFRKEIEAAKKSRNNIASVLTKKVKTLQADLDVRTQPAQKCKEARDAALASSNTIALKESSSAVTRRNYIIALLCAIIACEILYDIYEDAFIGVFREFIVSYTTFYAANCIMWYSINLKRNIFVFLVVLCTIVWWCPSIFENIQQSAIFDMSPTTTTTTTTGKTKKTKKAKMTTTTTTTTTSTTLFRVHYNYNYDEPTTTSTPSATTAFIEDIWWFIADMIQFDPHHRDLYVFMSLIVFVHIAAFTFHYLLAWSPQEIDLQRFCDTLSSCVRNSFKKVVAFKKYILRFSPRNWHLPSAESVESLVESVESFLVSQLSEECQGQAAIALEKSKNTRKKIVPPQGSEESKKFRKKQMNQQVSSCSTQGNTSALQHNTKNTCCSNKDGLCRKPRNKRSKK